MKTRYMLLLAIGILLVVIGSYLGVYFLGDITTSWSICAVRSAGFKSQMERIAAAIEHYRKAKDGRIPTMDELIKSDSSFLPAATQEKQRLCEMFVIVSLPMCVVKEGERRDAYVLYAKIPPKVQDWGLVIVDGEDVNI